MHEHLDRRPADPQPQAPGAAEVRRQLERLLESADLNISDRNRRFLAYVVEETLAGRGERIKAYNIALTAFARGEDFDPQTDPIVRIEASRLRRALEHYYLTVGHSDPLRIEIPKGSYIASFRYADPLGATPVAALETPKPPRRLPVSALRRPRLQWALAAVAGLLVAVGVTLTTWQANPSAETRMPSTGNIAISIQPFSDAESSSNRSLAARSFTFALIDALTKTDGIAAYASDEAVETGVRTASTDGRGYIVSGSAHATADRLYVSVAMIDPGTSQYLQAWNFDHDLTGSDLLAAEAAIAHQVARAIVQANGAGASLSTQNVAQVARTTAP